MKSVTTLEFGFVHFWNVLMRRKEPGSQLSSLWVASGMGDSSIPVSAPPGLEQEFKESRETSHQQLVSGQEALEEDTVSLSQDAITDECECSWFASAAE